MYSEQCASLCVKPLDCQSLQPDVGNIMHQRAGMQLLGLFTSARQAACLINGSAGQHADQQDRRLDRPVCTCMGGTCEEEMQSSFRACVKWLYSPTWQ